MSNATTEPAVEDLVARVTALNDEIAAVTAKAGSEHLATVDTTLNTVAEIQERFAESIGDPALSAIVGGQANLTRELIKVNSAHRELLK
jgi:hypothetical protein